MGAGQGEGSLSMSVASLDSSAIIILSGLTCVQNKIYGLAKITCNFVSEVVELKSSFNKVSPRFLCNLSVPMILYWVVGGL